MSFGVLNIEMALQIINKILFEESFGDALRMCDPKSNVGFQISPLDSGT